MTRIDLKARLSRPEPLLAPGVYDALSALLAQQAGFEALYLSGASIAYTLLGRSDVGLTTYTEVQQVLGHITERVDTPVIVDADTGFGNALNVMRTVKGFERAGAAMIQLEDQTFPKRCGVGPARLSHCHFSRRNGARHDPRAAGLLRQPAPAPNHRTVAAGHARFPRAERGDRHARAAGRRAEIPMKSSIQKFAVIVTRNDRDSIG